MELRVLLTDKCQLRCQFCHLEGMAEQEEATYISPTTALYAFRALKGVCNSSVTVSGGEPLLHPELDRILQFLALEDARITIVTNGLLLGVHNKSMKNVFEVHVSLPSASESQYAGLTQGNLNIWFAQVTSFRSICSHTRLKINSTLIDGVNDSEQEICELLRVSGYFAATLKIIRCFDPSSKRSAKLSHLKNILLTMGYRQMTIRGRAEIWHHPFLPTAEIAEVTCSFAMKSQNPSRTCAAYRDLLITPDERLVWCPWHGLGWTIQPFLEQREQRLELGDTQEDLFLLPCPEHDENRSAREAASNERVEVN